MRKNLSWTAAAVIVVATAFALGWGTFPTASGWDFVEIWESEGQIAYAGGVPAMTGFENVYIMAHGNYNAEENLSGHANILRYQGQPAVIEGDGWNVNIPYETRFDIVAAAKGKAPDNLAYAVKENIRVRLQLSGAFSWDEYSSNSDKYVYENENYGSTAGWVRVNFVFDNNGSGFIIRAGQSLNYTVTLECWG